MLVEFMPELLTFLCDSNWCFSRVVFYLKKNNNDDNTPPTWRLARIKLRFWERLQNTRAIVCILVSNSITIYPIRMLSGRVFCNVARFCSLNLFDSQY